MFKLKYQFIGILIGMTIVQYSTASAVRSFKSSKFLEYPAEGQKSYITSSILAAGLIAAQNNKTQARCIDNWGAKYRDDGYQPIINAMRRYPDDHPTSLILAVLQRDCGSFKYGQ